MTVKSSDPVIDKQHSVRSEIVFLTFPCKFETARDTAALSSGGFVNKGNDWASARTEDFIAVAADRVTVVEGEVLWRLTDGETTEGGFERINEIIPADDKSCLKFALLGAIAGYAIKS